jgi:hypothetical protein
LDLKRNGAIDLFLLDVDLLTPFIVNKHIEGKVHLVAFGESTNCIFDLFLLEIFPQSRGQTLVSVCLGIAEASRQLMCTSQYSCQFPTMIACLWALENYRGGPLG